MKPMCGLQRHSRDDCVPEGSLISCLRGNVPIEQVTENDLVLTRGGYRRVDFVEQTGEDEQIIQIIAGQHSFYCTPEHRVWTQEGFTKADNLVHNDQLLCIEDKKWPKEVGSVVFERLKSCLNVTTKPLKQNNEYGGVASIQQSFKVNLDNILDKQMVYSTVFDVIYGNKAKKTYDLSVFEYNEFFVGGVLTTGSF